MQKLLATAILLVVFSTPAFAQAPSHEQVVQSMMKDGASLECANQTADVVQAWGKMLDAGATEAQLNAYADAHTSQKCKDESSARHK